MKLVMVMARACKANLLKSKIIATWVVHSHQHTRTIHGGLRTPWLIERISWPSCWFVRGSTPFEDWTALWNAAGSSTAITLNVNKDELSCTAPAMSQQRHGS